MAGLTIISWDNLTEIQLEDWLKWDVTPSIFYEGKNRKTKKIFKIKNNNKMIIMFIFVNTKGALRLIYFGPALDRLTFKGGSEQVLNKRELFHDY